MAGLLGLGLLSCSRGSDDTTAEGKATVDAVCAVRSLAGKPPTSWVSASGRLDTEHLVVPSMVASDLTDLGRVIDDPEAATAARASARALRARLHEDRPLSASEQQRLRVLSGWMDQHC